MILGLSSNYAGRMEKNMETTMVYWRHIGSIGVI